MRRRIRLTVWMLLTVLAAAAAVQAAEAAKRPSNTADKPQVELWPVGKAPGQKAGKPRVTSRGLNGIYDPWMAVHLPPKNKANGAAVVICPGGGYGGLAYVHEGIQVAQWLNSHGVAGFVLRYRHRPHKHPIPLGDAQRAIRIVRSRSKEWGVDPKRIGILGFSAGGHLAASATTHFDAGKADAPDPIDRVSCRPDFSILIYAVISMKQGVTHGGSRNNLLGDNPDEKLVELMSNELQVTAKTPPTFLVHSTDDGAVPPANSKLFHEACKKAHVPSQLHIYKQGGHGYGLGRKGHDSAEWPARCAEWLKARKLLDKKKESAPKPKADAAAKASAANIRESDFCRSLEYVGVAVGEPGYHVWGSSPIMDEQGKVHLFVARWPTKRPFDQAWRHDSEITHYVGDGPEGPFKFSDVALRGTGKDTWDRYAPSNPLIKRIDGQYVLLYTANPVGMTRGKGRHPGTQRIGMAVAKSLNGPWKRAGKDGKILDPSGDPKHWTHRAQVVNPAFLKHPNGKYHLYYKGRGARMGVAIAEKLTGPYVHQPKPLSSNEQRVEDGYAFMTGGKFYLLTTDNHGVNIRGGGLLWKSDDGITFDPVPEIGYKAPRSYLPQVERKRVRTYYGAGTFQRPQVLMQNDRPTHLYVPSGTNIKGTDGTISYVLRCNPKKQAMTASAARPQIIKTGTIDLDVVEAHYFVWKGRLLREQWCKAKYRGKRGLPASHIAIYDVETSKLLASLAQDHAFGTVFVEDGTVYVMATYDRAPKRRSQVNLFASKDLKTWKQWNVIDDPQFKICNTSLIKVKDEYVLMFEIGKPRCTSWTARFAKSKDLRKWKILPEQYIHGRNKMAAPHCLKYHDGYFYNFHVVRHRGYSTFVSRSKDLKHWADSPLNPMLTAHEDDRKLAPGMEFTAEQKQRIATAKDHNNSDIDIFEHKGKCLISYSWGNQHGTEHLATAEYLGSLASFLEGWFPAKTK